MTRTLVLGGARSGKSGYADRLAIESGKEVVYIATATAGDAEMATRIAHHRAGRPSEWTTVEEPLALGNQLLRWSSPDRLILVDCLTLWLSNLLFSSGEQYPDVGEITLPALFHEQQDMLASALTKCASDVVLVSNEVGMGIMPFGAISRCFVDEQGRLNQAMAALCDRAVFVAAGLPLVLKGAPC
ncbi:bifunctional adenosylcobinamide kinase/adenosylcobinamide-phosphate guanylyltransferase [Duganella sp. BJB488]|uniref:bifunctional adenosylcobinamide kinase/adenosylcobinamide-phosphate guanylyltransferase n=1 Tax=Duganella TaxID=75654 RepID=UPI000E349A5A|nr:MULTISPECIES: bifunctional adenosylcobinamide kinase/adenosylcobinamide-phosphate guanylyltransferase [unclassified Duganella]NVD75002.1 bifunctional adenosylcobinamide kinase/adenosylcobinamide-phosphate guanylyltransferase [Duganella sp. BJB1802]RFP08515.1 bifunctional adenosylcobinamide kinase/adenosylcobinamide-phosphate guanylyltransferase [Duganella sp. BJB489]RFP11136.1 bifunctional adenosylcobinamide kinase/adenosylcobinamide-phosphate guanylyltransferase [Duganella sp. BJB488]RFP278